MNVTIIPGKPRIFPIVLTRDIKKLGNKLFTRGSIVKFKKSSSVCLSELTDSNNTSNNACVGFFSLLSAQISNYYINLITYLLLITLFGITNHTYPICLLSMKSSFGLIKIVHAGWAGLVTGCLHTLVGPDHLAALTPITIGQTKIKSVILGALWGLGHSLGQLTLGVIFILMKDKFDSFIPALNKYGGVLIGITLLIIGIIGIYESSITTNYDCKAIKNNSSGKNADDSEKIISSQSFVTFMTGVVYGFNPDTLIFLIPALALPSKTASFIYIVMFFIGTVVAMAGYTFAISATTEIFGEKTFISVKNLSVISAIISILFGILVLLSSLGFSLPLFL